MSRGWANASACRLQITLYCAFLCHIVSLQYLSMSSLHRLTGLPCRIFLSYGPQVVTREVRRLSLRRLICPAQDHFSFLTVLIISMTLVLSLDIDLTNNLSDEADLNMKREDHSPELTRFSGSHVYELARYRTSCLQHVLLWVCSLRVNY